MNIVSNFVGSISPEMFGSASKDTLQGINLGDTTFSDLLDKQLNNMKNSVPDFTKNFGFPSGINNIVDIDGDFSQGINIRGTKEEIKSDMLEQIKPVNTTENTDFSNLNNKKDLSTSEVVTFFTSLFDSKPTITDTTSSELFDFERKVATGKYDKYAKNVITNIGEFVTDTIKMKSES